MKLEKNIINEKNGRITFSKNFVITTLALFFLSVCGWALLKVSEIPECFATKQEVRNITMDLSSQLLESKQDYIRGHEELNQRLDSFEKSINANLRLIGAELESIDEFLKNSKQAKRD